MCYDALRVKIETKQAQAGIIGLGYVGLPLAMAYLDAGYDVIGYDVDAAKIAKLKDGKSYIGDVADDRIRASLASGRFRPAAEARVLRDADVIAVCVPTPLKANKEPDMSYLVETCRTLSRHLRPGQLVIVESTVYPGATRAECLPLLEAGGLTAGKDFWLAFSPERVDPGNERFPIKTIPTVVGGVDDRATELACLFYKPVVVEVVPVSSAEAAEMSKLLENTYRAVNIALVNELKIICHKMGLDVFEVIAAAATKPYGFQKFLPGPGVGGHCIPLDPYYLSWRARQFGYDSQFVELAGRVNDSMPAYVVARLTAALEGRGRRLNGAKVLVLGVAYKRDVDDLRESPALETLALIRQRGAEVAYHDPYCPVLPRVRKHDFGLKSVPLTAEALSSYDAAVILTDHSAVDYEMVFTAARLVVDARGVAQRLGITGPHIVTA